MITINSHSGVGMFSAAQVRCQFGRQTSDWLSRFKNQDKQVQDEPLKLIPPDSIAIRPAVKEGDEKPLRRLTKLMMGVLPVSNLVAGLCLIVSCFLPQPATTSEQPVSKNTPSAISQPQEMAAVTPVQNERNLLNQVGWGLIAVNMTAGVFSSLPFGLVNKQPGMVLSSGVNTVLSPFLLLDPTFALRAAISFMGVTWFLGFANKFRNEYALKPGEAPREMDMSALVSPKKLKELFPDADPDTLQLLQAWGKEAAKFSWFVASDPFVQANKAISDYQSKSQEPTAQRVSFRKNAQTQWQQTRAYLKKEQSTPPDWLKPSAGQSQVTAILTTAGSIPIMVMGGSPEVAKQGFRLIGLGSLGSSLSWFLTGLNKKDKWLVLAMPISTVSQGFQHTDLGVGVARATSPVAISSYMRKEVLESMDKADQADAEKALKKQAEKAIRK